MPCGDGFGGFTPVHQATLYFKSQAAQTLELRIDERLDQIGRESGKLCEVCKGWIKSQGKDDLGHFFHSALRMLGQRVVGDLHRSAAATRSHHLLPPVDQL